MGETDVLTLVNADFRNWLRTDNNFDENMKFETEPRGEFFRRSLDVNKLVRTATKRLGHDGILGITEASDEARFMKLLTLLEKHAYKVENFGNAAYLSNEHLWLIRGEEVYMGEEGAEGRILVLGLEDKDRLPHNAPKEDTFEMAHERGAIIIANPNLVDLSTIAQSNYTTAIETKNRSMVWPFKGLTKLNPNALSQDYFDKHNFGQYWGNVETSGGHTIEEIGISYNKMQEISKDHKSLNAKSIREDLRKSIINAKPGKDSHFFSPYIGNFQHARRLQEWAKVAQDRERDDRGIYK